MPASLGPGLRTVSGAKRSLGGKSSPSAVCPMTGESTNSQKMLLAVAIAEGTSVATWASTNGVPERTAYRWAAENKNQWTCISRWPDWLFQFVAFHPSLLLATLKWRVDAVGGGFTPASAWRLPPGIKRGQREWRPEVRNSSVKSLTPIVYARQN